MARRRVARRKVARKKATRKVARKPAKKKVAKGKKLRCSGKTLAGTRCKRPVTGKGKFCAVHKKGTWATGSKELLFHRDEMKIEEIR